MAISRKTVCKNVLCGTKINLFTCFEKDTKSDLKVENTGTKRTFDFVCDPFTAYCLINKCSQIYSQREH